MRYYIAMFLRDDVRENGYHHVTNYWKRDSTAHESLEKAEAVRKKMLDSDPIFNGVKVVVFSEHKWRALPVGYKHPADRRDSEVHPKRNKHETGMYNPSKYNDLAQKIGAVLSQL